MRGGVRSPSHGSRLWVQSQSQRVFSRHDREISIYPEAKAYSAHWARQLLAI